MGMFFQPPDTGQARDAASRRALLWGFGLVLALLAGVSALGVVSALKLTESTRQLHQHPFTVSSAIRNVDAKVAKIRLAMAEMVLGGDPGSVEGVRRAVAESEQAAQDDLALVRANYLGDKAEVAELSGLLEDWRSLRAHIFGLAEQGRMEEARLVALTSGADTYAHVQDLVEKIAAFARNKASYFLEQTRENAARAMLISLLAGGAALLLGLLVTAKALRGLGDGERRLASTFEQAGTGMAHVSREGRLLRVNGKLCAMLGYTPDELAGKPIQGVLLPADHGQAQDADPHCGLCPPGAQPHAFCEDRMLARKDGGTVWATVSTSLAILSPRDEPYFILVLQDITERRAMAEALEKAQCFIRNILDSMPSVMVGVDPEGRVTHLNTAASQALGVRADQAVGSALDQVFPALSGQLDAVRQSVRERRPIHREGLPRAVEGETRFEDVLIYPLVANGVEGAVMRVDDVTERVRLAEMMVRSEKMTSVAGLAAGMAHEINNPLGAILQSAQVIQSHLDPEKPANIQAARETGCTMEALRGYMEKRGIPDFLANIREAGSRAGRIVANMLEFSRQSPGVRQLVSAGDMVERALQLASHDYDLKKKYDFRNIAIHREYDLQAPKVWCGRGEIEQVLLNLLKNAAQAMASGRQPVQPPAITVRVRALGGGVGIEVEDNGPGMDAAVRSRIFEPFFTTKGVGQGTGLGLSVSAFIVEQLHGGKLSVDSAPGRGARFTLELPPGAAPGEAPA